MIQHADTVQPNSVIDTDVCVIGSGPAGIAVALGLQNSMKKILVLESGERDITEQKQILNTLRTTGLSIKRDSRIRSFGGTTHRWTGGWKPHDVFDFAKKEWVPFSGWPIQFADISNYYEKASHIFHAPSANALKPEKYWSTYPLTRYLLETDTVTTTIVPSIAQPYWNFGKVFSDVFSKSETLDVILGGTVTKLVEESKSISAIIVQTTAGVKFSVKAKFVVIAAGGIESARLLLLSNIGNEYDQVGRYYMDHPKISLGSVRLSNKVYWEGVYWNAPQPFGHARVGVQLTASAQAKNLALNSYARFEPSYKDCGLFKKILRHVFPWGIRIREFSVMNFMEQVPHPDNRVRLSEDNDLFGNPLPVVDWKLFPIDINTLCTLHRELYKVITDNGIGTLTSPLLSEADDKIAASVKDASHHMGTTRMGTDPATSVVDAQCKVHSITNLFVAGSSVFPTGGFANPVATSIALALRLADHLKVKMDV